MEAIIFSRIEGKTLGFSSTHLDAWSLLSGLNSLNETKVAKTSTIDKEKCRNQSICWFSFLPVYLIWLKLNLNEEEEEEDFSFLRDLEVSNIYFLSLVKTQHKGAFTYDVRFLGGR